MDWIENPNPTTQNATHKQVQKAAEINTRNRNLVEDSII